MTPLRQRMCDDMQVHNLAPHTQRSYLQQVSQFARHFGKSPEPLGPDDIRAYQLHLTQDRSCRKIGGAPVGWILLRLFSDRGWMRGLDVEVGEDRG